MINKMNFRSRMWAALAVLAVSSMAFGGNSNAIFAGGPGGVTVGVDHTQAEIEGQVQAKRGARILGAVDALLGAIGAVLDVDGRISYMQAIAFARAQLSTKEFEKAWAEGRVMTIEQTIALALEGSASEMAISGSRPSDTAVLRPFYLGSLTRREVEVLRLMADGLTNAMIAERLFLRTPTVNSHLTSIYSKLGVTGRNAATRIAIEHSLV